MNGKMPSETKHFIISGKRVSTAHRRPKPCPEAHGLQQHQSKPLPISLTSNRPRTLSKTARYVKPHTAGFHTPFPLPSSA